MIAGLIDRMADAVAQAPAPQQLGMVFLGGVLTSANPCVLVAAPLVVGFTGGTKGGRHHPLILSGAFVLGLALVFTVLGLGAALTGSLLGDVGWGWKALLGAILLVIGLHLLGLYPLPELPRARMEGLRGAGVWGALALGGLTGTLSAPCATPALAAVLTLVALQKRILWGGVLLFAYALGHVLLLFLAGASSGWAGRMTQGRFVRVMGRWYPKIMGLILTGCAAWVLRVAWQAKMAG